MAERTYSPEVEVKKAAQITKLLLSIPIESRGNVLLKVADELTLYTQHYTAQLIRRAAETYNRGGN